MVILEDSQALLQESNILAINHDHVLIRCLFVTACNMSCSA